MAIQSYYTLNPLANLPPSQDIQHGGLACKDSVNWRSRFGAEAGCVVAASLQVLYRAWTALIGKQWQALCLRKLQGISILTCTTGTHECNKLPWQETSPAFLQDCFDALCITCVDNAANILPAELHWIQGGAVKVNSNILSAFDRYSPFTYPKLVMADLSHGLLALDCHAFNQAKRPERLE